jgi:hypothetical protein
MGDDSDTVSDIEVWDETGATELLQEPEEEKEDVEDEDDPLDEEEEDVITDQRKGIQNMIYEVVYDSVSKKSKFVLDRNGRKKFRDINTQMSVEEFISLVVHRASQISSRVEEDQVPPSQLIGAEYDYEIDIAILELHNPVTRQTFSVLLEREIKEYGIVQIWHPRQMTLPDELLDIGNIKPRFSQEIEKAVKFHHNFISRNTCGVDVS